MDDQTRHDDSAQKPAGPESPHLDRREKQQAERHSAPHALVIHEVVREEGEVELKRRTGALIWSGVAAGLSMGFSMIGMALAQSALPDAPWRRLLDSPFYSVGFVIAILGRQQLFTESTLTAILPLMLHRNWATFLAVLRLWGLVLASNLVGTIAIAALISRPGVFSDAVRQSMVEIGQDVIGGEVGPKIIKAMLAGWLIALMVWLLPSARSARLFVILLLTYLVAVARFPHVVAGSAEAAFAVFAGPASASGYVFGFLLPTLLGNTIGGVALVAFLNHAPLASELQEGPSEKESRKQRPPLPN
jgi:formate/nitrite transporter FocA (FNT family)